MGKTSRNRKNNVIHRDIKPSNIRRRKSDNKIVLIDFGAVKQISSMEVNEEGETKFTVPIGTYGYMPSEQAIGNPKLSSDIYAVGIIGKDVYPTIIKFALHKCGMNLDLSC